MQRTPRKLTGNEFCLVDLRCLTGLNLEEAAKVLEASRGEGGEGEDRKMAAVLQALN